jgi:hypothetical protein
VRVAPSPVPAQENIEVRVAPSPVPAGEEQYRWCGARKRHRSRGCCAMRQAYRHSSTNHCVFHWVFHDTYLDCVLLEKHASIQPWGRLPKPFALYCAARALRTCITHHASCIMHHASQDLVQATSVVNRVTFLTVNISASCFAFHLGTCTR